VVDGERALVFQHFEFSGGGRPLATLVARFERENPGVEIVERMLPSSSDEQHRFYVTNLAAGSDDFDVLAIDVVWTNEFARAGWLQEVDDLVAPDEREDFLAGALQASTFEEKLHALPWFVDAGLLYYRSDLLARHGFAPPETYAELRDSARAILVAEGDPDLHGYVWQGKQYEGLVCVALEMVHAAEGAFVLDGRAALEHAATLRALRFLRALVEDGITPELVSTLDEEGARRIFASGRAIYMRNWPYAWPLLQAQGSPVRDEVGIAPLPRFEGGHSVSALGGWQLGVNRFSRRPELARRFARFLCSPDAQRELALALGYLPSRRSVYRDPAILERRPLVARLLEVAERAEPRPVTPYYPMIARTLQSELSAIVIGLRSPEEAARRATHSIDHVLAMEEP
jgi:multiple sugar transport system substrate-binding protein